MRKLIKLNNIKKLRLNKFWAIMALILVLVVSISFQSKFILTHLDASLKNLGFSLKEIIVGFKVCILMSIFYQDFYFI